jgi:transposase
MTRQLRRYIARQALVESFNVIAKRVGRSEKSIRKVFEKHRIHLEGIRKVEAPRVMGGDGVYVKRKESLIITDLERKRPVLMCPFIKEYPVAAALRQMSGIDKVEDVVTDMSPSLHRARKAAVPKAQHTYDRYHVQRMANADLDIIRKVLTPGKRERKKGQMGMCSSHILRKRNNKLKVHERADLDWCLGLYPLLRLTYELKEAYCEVWSALDSATARRRYAAWLELHKAWKKEMPKDLQAAFDPLIRAMKKSDEEIFNYFKNRYTNAYTESANAKVKEIARKAPRAKFSTVSTKVIHGRRLAQQREAVRQRGKQERRRAGTTQQPQPSSPVATVQAVTPPNEVQTSFVIQSPSAVDLKRQGPRLDVARIVSLRRRKEEIQAVPLSPQMALFQ